MKKIFAVSAILSVFALAALAETDPKALPIIQDIQKGTDNNNTPTLLAVKAQNGHAAFAVDVGPSATQVWLTQVGTNNMLGGTITTNTFPVSFLTVPTVIYQFTDADKPSTNLISVATNRFTIAGNAGVNGNWIARGRIK